MPLQFTAATSDRVQIAAAASINSLAAGTVLVWALLTSGANRTFMGKSTPATAGWLLRVGDSSTLDLRCAAGRATTNANALSQTNFVTAGDVPQFLGGTWDINGAASDQTVVRGTLLSVASEPATYSAQTLGSGAKKDDSAQALCLGNESSIGLASPGMVLFWAGLWNRRLSLQEIRSLQFNPRVTRGCVGFWRPGANGRGLVIDESGSGNHGTITGAYPTSDRLPRVLRSAA